MVWGCFMWEGVGYATRIEGRIVRYHISYCNMYAMHIYVSFIFKYILLSILASYIHLVQ